MPDLIKEKHPDLSSTFLRGSLVGQIRSVFKARFDRPGKVEDFIRAIADGAVTLSGDIPRPEQAKLAVLGVELPEVATKPEMPASSMAAAAAG